MRVCVPRLEPGFIMFYLFVCFALRTCVCRSIKCLACHRRCGWGDSRRGQHEVGGVGNGTVKEEGGQLVARVSCYAGPNELPRFVSIILSYCMLLPHPYTLTPPLPLPLQLPLAVH